ncbi:Protein ERGIC-53 [Portunus trituberculatus]|uniref:Protein ERGIC-53 n=1 Tax=Portunus trituberculatus TaxID=210409 RepID=A0A5B7DXJ9_PORTR|nr:Protein ERGIC-53 [Portunus trituberculatus]
MQRPITKMLSSITGGRDVYYCGSVFARSREEMELWWSLTLLLSLISVGRCQKPHKRFEYKFSFKGPYLAQKDNQVPFWHYSGNAIASEESVRITPSLRSQKGQIWTKNPTNFEWWEVEFVFRVTGRGRIGADGLALWFTDKPGGEGPVFGSTDKWNGLGVFFDSFDNDNKRNNPYVMAMVNDGTKVYDHEHDGLSQQLGGCLRDFRNKPFPVRAKVEYYHNVLTLKTQNIEYDYTKMEEEFEEGPQGTKAPSDDGEVTAQPATQEEHTAVPDHHEGQDLLESDAPNENIFASEAIDAGYTLVEAINDIAEEELSEGWGWFGAASSDEPIVTTTTPPTSHSNTTTKAQKRRRKRERKRRGKKKKKVRKTSPVLMIHSGMTNNEKDYEICMRAENVHLPPSGHFGVSAATGGLADDHDRDLGTANQRLTQGGGGACPSISCVSTTVFIVFMVLQVVLLIGYIMYSVISSINYYEDLSTNAVNGIEM